MGSPNYYTFQQAAERLQRSKRSLHYYVTNGRLKKLLVDGTPFLDATSVEEMAEELGTDKPVVNRSSIIRLQIEVQSLKEQVALLKRVYGVRDQPLRMDPSSALSYFEAAGKYLSAGSWDLGALELWAEQFEKMDEDFFETVKRVTNDEKPWKVFFDLSRAMVKHTYQAQPRSLTLQALTQRLALARKHLRGVILVFLELNPPKDPTARAALEAPGELLAKRLVQG